MKPAKIDLGPDCFEWQKRSKLATLLGVTKNAISNSIVDGFRVAGYEIERLELTDALRADLGISDNRVTSVYRVLREKHSSDLANARAKASTAEEPEPWRQDMARLRGERDGLVEKVRDLQAQLAQLEKTSDSEQALRKRIAQLESSVEQLQAELEATRQIDGTTSPNAVLTEAMWSALGGVDADDMREILATALKKVVGP